jgi:4-oxalocrotonate tautomerase
VVAVRTHSFFTRNHVCKRRDSEILEEAIRPLIQVQVIEEVFTPAQKCEIVRKLTDAVVSIEGESMRPVTSVVIEEVKSGDWAMGGKPLTTDDVNALAGSRQTG